MICIAFHSRDRKFGAGLLAFSPTAESQICKLHCNLLSTCGIIAKLTAHVGHSANVVETIKLEPQFRARKIGRQVVI